MSGRLTVAEIDLAALRHNFTLVRQSTPDGYGILAVVKADAYGHGFLDVSRELEKLGVDAFAVATLGEAIQLRKSAVTRPVLVLGGVYQGEERRCVGYDISCAVYSDEAAAALDEAAARLYRKAKVHLEVDTGMGRLGVPHEDFPAFLARLGRFKHLEIEGLFSHFASADELDSAGAAYSSLQVDRFSAAVGQAHASGIRPRYVHIANSAAIFSQRLPFCNLVRPGIVLYGALPSADFQGVLSVRPVMRFKSKIAMLKWVEPGASISYARRFVARRRTLIASVPVGYADGYSRSLTGKGEVLIRGQRAPVAGTVCMDWIMLDVTEVRGASVGDEVTLLGPDPSGGCISAEEVAERAGTIPYDIFCCISKRVPRVYLGQS